MSFISPLCSKGLGISLKAEEPGYPAAFKEETIELCHNFARDLRKFFTPHMPIENFVRGFYNLCSQCSSKKILLDSTLITWLPEMLDTHVRVYITDLNWTCDPLKIAVDLVSVHPDAKTRGYYIEKKPSEWKTVDYDCSLLSQLIKCAIHPPSVFEKDVPNIQDVRSAIRFSPTCFTDPCPSEDPIESALARKRTPNTSLFHLGNLDKSWGSVNSDDSDSDEGISQRGAAPLAAASRSPSVNVGPVAAAAGGPSRKSPLYRDEEKADGAAAAAGPVAKTYWNGNEWVEQPPGSNGAPASRPLDKSWGSVNSDDLDSDEEQSQAIAAAGPSRKSPLYRDEQKADGAAAAAGPVAKTYWNGDEWVEQPPSSNGAPASRPLGKSWDSDEEQSQAIAAAPVEGTRGSALPSSSRRAAKLPAPAVRSLVQAEESSVAPLPPSISAIQSKLDTPPAYKDVLPYRAPECPAPEAAPPYFSVAAPGGLEPEAYFAQEHVEGAPGGLSPNAQVNKASGNTDDQASRGGGAGAAQGFLRKTWNSLFGT